MSLLSCSTSVETGKRYVVSADSLLAAKEGRPVNLRGAWEVRCGLQIGVPEAQHTRTFCYSVVDYKQDSQRDSSEQAETVFVDLRTKAFEYAQAMMQAPSLRIGNPFHKDSSQEIPAWLHTVNIAWVEIVWVWYWPPHHTVSIS